MGRRPAFVVDETALALHRAEELLRVAIARMDAAHQRAEETCDEESYFHCTSALIYRRRAVEQVERIAWLRQAIKEKRP